MLKLYRLVPLCPVPQDESTYSQANTSLVHLLFVLRWNFDTLIPPSMYSHFYIHCLNGIKENSRTSFSWITLMGPVFPAKKVIKIGDDDILVLSLPHSRKPQSTSTETWQEFCHFMWLSFSKFMVSRLYFIGQ